MQKGSAPMNHIKLDREKKIPHVKTKLRSHHIVTMPDEIYAASGIVIMGRRIKSLIFSTDIAIIRNCNADAVLAVYPFTPQQIIADAIVSTSSLPVFCGVGGGTTTGARVVMLAKDAEAFGAMAVVVNAPTTNDVIAQIADIIDIPIVVTVLDENTDIDARLEAGATIFNVSAAARSADSARTLPRPAHHCNRRSLAGKHPRNRSGRRKCHQLYAPDGRRAVPRLNDTLPQRARKQNKGRSIKKHLKLTEKSV